DQGDDEIVADVLVRLLAVAHPDEVLTGAIGLLEEVWRDRAARVRRMSRQRAAALVGPCVRTIVRGAAPQPPARETRRSGVSVRADFDEAIASAIEEGMAECKRLYGRRRACWFGWGGVLNPAR